MASLVVTLSGGQLDPSQLPPLRHLTRLDCCISKAGTYAAVACWSSVSRLQHLALSLPYTKIDGQQHQLPPAVGQLPHLNRLELLNVLDAQPLAAVVELTRLRALKLEGIYPALMDSISSLSNLGSLGTNASHLQQLPASTGQLTGITSLNLYRCTSLQQLPDSIGQLTGITSLNLDCCRALQQLPDSIGQLTGITSLDLSDCSEFMVMVVRLPGT
jgi:Leucine-rich repeat (LRR) protein